MKRRFSNQLIDKIRDHTDLIAIVSEYLSLKRTGQNYSGLCPFHQENSPSFVVSPIKKVFHCFGCGVGGDLFHFITKIEGISFTDALERLSERAGISLPYAEAAPGGDRARSEKDEVYRVNKAAADIFHNNLLESPEGLGALRYLKGRGLSSDAIQAFKIGYALRSWDHLIKKLGKNFSLSLLECSGLVSRKRNHDASSQENRGCFDRFRDRIMFPICTSQGKVAGFGGRVLDDSMPKYLNSPETAVFTKGRHLFGLNHVKGGGNHRLIVVEGYLDVIAAHQAGIPNVVATLGTALTQDHLKLVRRLSEKMVLIFDADDAGLRAALRAGPLLIGEGISAKIVSLPIGKDPDTFIREKGKHAFLQEVERGEAIVDFAISQFIKAHPSKSVEDKMKVIQNAFPLIGRLRSQVEKSHYLQLLSELLHIREEDLRAEYAKRSRAAKRSSLQQKPTVPSEKNPDVPQEQEGVLMLLLQGFLDPLKLNGKLDIEDFTSPPIKKIIAHYWNDEESQWVSPSYPIELADEQTARLMSRLSLSKVDQDRIQQLERDYIRLLLKKRNDRERIAIASRLRKMAGKEDPEALKRILELKKASSHLSLSH